jgi:hypothetical protein
MVTTVLNDEKFVSRMAWLASQNACLKICVQRALVYATIFPLAPSGTPSHVFSLSKLVIPAVTFLALVVRLRQTVHKIYSDFYMTSVHSGILNSVLGTSCYGPYLFALKLGSCTRQHLSPAATQLNSSLASHIR